MMPDCRNSNSNPTAEPAFCIKYCSIPCVSTGIIQDHSCSDNKARSASVGNTLVVEVVFACSIALRARILARSVSGLLITVSNLKRFLAETGGQFRMITMSSFCSSGSNFSASVRLESDSKAYDFRGHASNTSWSALYATRKMRNNTKKNPGHSLCE